MNNYITGAVIRKLREKKGITQSALAEKINVSDKTVSKWETGKGLPDIALIESLSKALGVSVIELMSGEYITNKNISSNILHSEFYVCPVCGNIIHSNGEALISCCGITLPPLEAEEADCRHTVEIQPVEDEHYISVSHEMTKEHHISFIAFVSTDKCSIIKLYPESNAQVRLNLRGGGYVYIYCNKHGLIKKKV